MSVTFQQLLDRAEEAATNIAIDASQSPLVDSEVTAEVIYPHAVRSVFRDYAKTGRHLDDMQMEHSITLTSGVGTLPDNVIRECLDHAYIPSDQFASKVPYEDYLRYRYDSQMSYFAIRGSNFYYSGDYGGAAAFIRTETDTGSGTITSAILGFTNAAFRFADIGRRIKVVSASDVILVDAIITAVGTNTQCSVAAWPLSEFIATTNTYTIYDCSDDVTLRSLTSVSTTEGSATVTCAGGAFTAADVGRRLRVLAVDGTTVILDAIIERVVSATQIKAYGLAKATDAAGTATVKAAPLKINTPGIPTAPTAGSDVLTFAPAIMDDIVMKIASVLRGTTSLESLTGGNDVRK